MYLLSLLLQTLPASEMRATCEEEFPLRCQHHVTVTRSSLIDPPIPELSCSQGDAAPHTDTRKTTVACFPHGAGEASVSLSLDHGCGD